MMDSSQVWEEMDMNAVSSGFWAVVSGIYV